MHSLLEKYLSEIAEQLSALPPKRRTEEVREMRTHLENAVIVGQEIGRTEDEAAQVALMQFGTLNDFGENLVWAWRRERAQEQKSLWGSAGSFLLLICLHFWLLNQGVYWHYLPHAWLMYLGQHRDFGMAMVQGTILLGFAAAGLISGSLFPQRAVLGVCLGLLVFLIGMAGTDGLWSVLGWDRLGWVAAAVGSSWAGSRLKRGKSNAQLA